MSIATRNQRASAVNLFLPFGRVGPNPDGGDLATGMEREQAAGAYAFNFNPLVTVGANTPSKRASAINLFLPVGRVFVIPEPTGIDTAGERAWLAYSYQSNVGTTGISAFRIENAQLANVLAAAGGQLTRVPKVQVVRAAPKVVARTIGWDAVVRQAEGDSYSARKLYPVYRFGGGEQRRQFFEVI